MRTPPLLPLAIATVVLAGCEYLDRSSDAGHAGAGELALSVETPGTLGMGEEGAVLLILENTGERARDDVRIELFVPTWVEIGRVEPEGTEVTMVAMEDEEIRLSYRMSVPQLDPGAFGRVTQRLRIPPEEWWETGRAIGDRTIRARLVSEEGDLLGAEVRSRLELDTLATRAAGGNRAIGGVAARVERGRIGPVRLGMTPAEVGEAAPGSRDTTWTAEGMQERGISAPVAADARAVARIANGRVDLIESRDPRVRTAAGLGVGSTLAELREAYGETCVGVGEGRVAVWFPAEPGVSFALENVADAVAPDAEGLPSTARVRTLWVREGRDDCP